MTSSAVGARLLDRAGTALSTLKIPISLHEKGLATSSHLSSWLGSLCPLHLSYGMSSVCLIVTVRKELVGHCKTYSVLNSVRRNNGLIYRGFSTVSTCCTSWEPITNNYQVSQKFDALFPFRNTSTKICVCMPSTLTQIRFQLCSTFLHIYYVSEKENCHEPDGTCTFSIFLL